MKKEFKFGRGYNGVLLSLNNEIEALNLIGRRLERLHQSLSGGESIRLDRLHQSLSGGESIFYDSQLTVTVY